MSKAYLEPDEVTRLGQAATNLRDCLLIHILFRLGCRISEALGLAVSDVNLAQGTVRIEHLKVGIRLSCPQCSARLGRSHTFCPKCGVKVEQAVARELEHRKMRILPVDRGTLEMLRDYINRGGPISQGGKRLIFGINRHRAWQVIKECAEKSGLPPLVNNETGRVHHVSPHRLRDAFAVMAVQQDDSTDGVRMLQEWLGHANIGTTMRYRRVAGQELKGWYQKLWTEKETGGG